jgi:hypothetical protein
MKNNQAADTGGDGGGDLCGLPGDGNDHHVAVGVG